MPGPKMGPRPSDFDVQLVRQSPTFNKWSHLPQGERLRYACRDFVKGHADDEERLMRRIMIARRNNLKDHQTLKRARSQLTTSGGAGTASNANSNSNSNGEEAAAADSTSEEPPPLAKSIKTDHPSPESSTAPVVSSTTATTTTTTTTATTTSHASARRRRPSTLFSDAEVAKEMDVVAVESTRSYKTWLSLDNGAVFVYNQKYVRGQEGHDWLLRKNIWRRMRYRRENKKMVDKLLVVVRPTTTTTTKRNGNSASSLASQIIDQTLLESGPTAAAAAAANTETSTGATSSDDHDTASMNEAVEAAVKVAESYTQSAHYIQEQRSVNANARMVHNQHPLDTTNNAAALDAAAQLAAAASVDEEAVAAAAAASANIE